MSPSSQQATATGATYQQIRRPLPLQLLNWVGHQIPQTYHLGPLNLNETNLLETTENITGLSDWGSDSFRPRLQKLLDALTTVADLNAAGRYYFRRFYFVRLLANRLKLQDQRKRHPEIAQRPLPKPLFVVGMFRSGTTFLHNLLAEDPDCRWLHLGESLDPCPPPSPETWETDPRNQYAFDLLQFQNTLAPNFSTAHHIDVSRPVECSRLFEHDMVGHLFDFRADVKPYSDWLQEQYLTESYQYYRFQLQYLSQRWPGSHWVLKAPAHIYAIDALLKAFPDASIVYIHRDPLQVLPSCCSLSAIGRIRFADRVDATAVGQHWLQRLSEATARAMAVKEMADPDRFYDVDYQVFVKDPVAMIRQIYEYFGYPFTPQYEAKLNGWINDNPQHKRGVHRYTLEQFGLTEKAVKDRFGSYSWS
ncbi:MAG: sulfotransferase [Hormoscilla sp.]